MSVDGSMHTPLDSLEGKSDKMVKKVIDYKLLNGKRYYKVKWECTWEVEDSLFSCQGLVDQFWEFVNRVKSADDDISSERRRHISESEMVENNMNDCSEDMPCVQILDADTSEPEEPMYSEKGKFENFHVNDELIRKPLVNIKPSSKGENIIDENNLPSPPSMVTINPPRQELQIPHYKDGIGIHGYPKHPSSVFKRTSGVLDHEEIFKKSPDIIDLKLQRQHVNGVSSEDRRFQCHICGMAFKRKDMCKRHLRTHTNDCCYFCAICKKGFIRRYVLVKHLNKDHQTNDQTKILSTKRRRRDDVKQEPILKHQFLSKDESRSSDAISTDAPERVIYASESLSIDDEHDYDKKSEDVVIVFKVESDNTKMDSTSTNDTEKNPTVEQHNIDFSDNHCVENSAYIKTAVIAPLNSQSGPRIDNISSDQHESEKPIESTYPMCSRTNISLPNSLQTTNIPPYNSQFQFPLKDNNIGQSFNQHGSNI